MRPDSLLRLCRYINHLLTYLLTFKRQLNTRRILAFLEPKGGSQKATLVVLVVVVISSLKISKAFLVRSETQRNFAYTFMLTLPTDLPSQIFHLFYS